MQLRFVETAKTSKMSKILLKRQVILKEPVKFLFAFDCLVLPTILVNCHRYLHNMTRVEFLYNVVFKSSKALYYQIRMGLTK